MREISQTRVEPSDKHTDTLGALSPAAEETVEITDQDSLSELADKRYFDADSEPRTPGPVETTVEFPEYE